MAKKKSIDEVFECIKLCTAESQNCEVQKDGSVVCKPGYRKCVENCRKD